MKETPISTCETEFILKAIQENKRLDGRNTYDHRTVSITFGAERGMCQICLGNTRVYANVTSQVVTPKPSRPSEGVLFLNVELSPMASISFEPGRLSDVGVEINRLIERCIFESRALDLESLCIVAGEKVWAIRVDVHILNDDGNIIDCASIATITALAHFRRPDVSVSGHDVTVHTLEERNPVPLSLHHMPICISFAFFSQGKFLLLDPTEREEKVMEGKMVLAMNAFREICTLHMGGKMLLYKDQIMRCANISSTIAQEIVQLIKDSLSADENKRIKGEHVTFTENIKQSYISSSIQKRKAALLDLMQDDDENSKQMSDNSDDDTDANVHIKGVGTAILGEGGPSNWHDEDEDEDSDTQKKETDKKAKTKKKEKSGNNSEEEDVVMLSSEYSKDIGTSVEIDLTQDKKTEKTSRGWYSKDRF